MDNFVSRWGYEPLEDKGYLRVPGCIMRFYHEYPCADGSVGLRPNEFTLLCHVMSFHYDTERGQACPSIAEIAARMGMTPRNVQSVKSRMVKKNILRIESRPGKTDVYSFPKLAKFCYIKALTNDDDSIEIAYVDTPTPEETFTPTPEETFTPPLKKPSPEEIEVKTENKDSTTTGNALEAKDDLPTPPTSDEPTPNDLSRTVKAWTNAGGNIGRFTGQDLGDLINEHGADWVLAAIQEMQNEGAFMKSTRPLSPIIDRLKAREQHRPHYEALIKAFGLNVSDVDAIPSSSGEHWHVAAQIATSGLTPDQIAGLHAFVKRQAQTWSTGVTPKSLIKRIPAYKATLNNKKAYHPRSVAEQQPRPPLLSAEERARIKNQTQQAQTGVQS